MVDVKINLDSQHGGVFYAGEVMSGERERVYKNIENNLVFVTQAQLKLIFHNQRSSEVS